MRRIVLKKLRVENFKGCRERQIDFGDTTDIFGANASGKTTTFDAFTWLLFDRDSAGSTKFDIRPLDAAGKMIDNVEILVEAVLEVDGEEITLQKVQKQIWTKKRGSDTATFQGNTNTYEINSFPASEAEFKAKVAGIIQESLFKLLTDPRKFATLPWKEQRDILLKFISTVTEADILATDPGKYAPIADEVQAVPIEKCLEKARKAMVKLKDRQKELPARIDEASKSLVEVPELADLELQRNALNDQLAEIQKQRDDTAASFKAVDAVRDEIMQVKAEMGTVEMKARERIREALRDAEEAHDEATRKNNQLFVAKKDKEVELKSLQGKLPEKQAELERARKQYSEAAKITADTDPDGLQYQEEDFIKKFKQRKDRIADAMARVFPEDSTVCPVCHREYPAEQIEEMRENFEREKRGSLSACMATVRNLLTENLNSITITGNAASEAVKDLQAKIATVSAELETVKQDWTAATGEASRAYEYKNSLPTQPDLSVNQEYQALQDKLAQLQAQLAGMDTGEGIKQHLASREAEIRVQFDGVNRQFAAVEINDRAQERIEELMEEQRNVGQLVADQERKIYLLEEFSRAKMEMLSSGINRQFQIVNFKLFEVQINGGMKDTCEMTVGGVPYSSLNSAGKLQAGLDVIAALSRLYDVSAPIWIDNRESVTEIPAVDAQVINLYVSPEDKALRIEVA